MVLLLDWVGEVGLEVGMTRALLAAGFNTGEVLVEVGGETLFLLADALDEEAMATLVTLALALVPLGGAGERMGFLRHTLVTQAFLCFLFLQILQFLQSCAR